MQDKKHGIVIKPSFAAKAYGLEFIRWGTKKGQFSVEIPQESRLTSSRM
ncbi:MAG TPA: hypothetical protein VLG12_07635 [Candidatus Saccharimonadales bacterium]|nr:hypothetical protein [Candidatus Saccharimonadales bacterium]